MPIKNMQTNRKLSMKFQLACLYLFVSGCTAAMSNPYIRNGTNATSGSYPSVVAIGDGRSTCTGTFISDHVLITAAHCLKSNSMGLIDSQTYQMTVRAVAVYAHPSYDQNATYAVGPNDIGIVVFPKGTSTQYSRLAIAPPKLNDAFKIVGFGRISDNMPDSAGIKRIGSNKIAGLSNGVISFAGSSSSDGSPESLSSFGDSGGPLIINDNISGVCSGSGQISQTQAESLYTNIFNESAVGFLKSVAAKGVEIPGLDKLEQNKQPVQKPQGQQPGVGPQPGPTPQPGAPANICEYYYGPGVLYDAQRNVCYRSGTAPTSTPPASGGNGGGTQCSQYGSQYFLNPQTGNCVYNTGYVTSSGTPISCKIGTRFSPQQNRCI